MKKILIMDDDKSTLEVLGLIFNEDYEVELAEHSTVFFEKLYRFTPDLVIIDYVLSEEINGYDICLKMKNDKRLQGITVIVLSVMNNLILPQELKHCHLMAKPFDLITLTARVSALINPIN